MLRGVVLLPCLCASALAADWSFKGFFVGDWDMEKHTLGKVEYAHYSIKAAADGTLEGTYHEDGEDGPMSHAVVRVKFDDAHGKVGEFQLAKVPQPQESAEEPPIPQPQPEPKTIFDFDFHAQSDLQFHVSETKLQSKKGGSVQFVALDDSFVITRIGVNAEGKEQLSSWTAVRRGGPRKRVGDARADGKKSLLSRYGWYLGLAMLYVGYKGVTTKAVNMAMAAHSKKKK